MSLLGVGAQLALQAGRQPLVRVVRHQAHQLHPLLDLGTQAGAHSQVKLQMSPCNRKESSLTWCAAAGAAVHPTRFFIFTFHFY